MRALAALAAITFATPLWGQADVTLVAGDSIEVTTAGLPDYSGEFLVGNDGMVVAGRYGRFAAAGRTIQALEADIVAFARSIIRDPQVTVGLKRQAARYVYIVGPLAQDGSIVWVPGLSLRQLVAEYSRMDQPDDFVARVIRRGTLVRLVDLRSLVAGEPDDDLLLLPGDVLTVSHAASVYTLAQGAVVRPGPVRARPGDTVSAVIARAGGVVPPLLTEFTAEQVVVSVRRGGTLRTATLTEAHAMADWTVEDGDVVTVAPPATASVTIGGHVRNPGPYRVLAGATLAEVVAQAGGADAAGGVHRVVVLRGGEALGFDARVAPGRGAPAQVEQGDYIYVPATDRTVHVFGFVTSPGAKILPLDRESRLVDALALADGLNAKGVMRRVVLLRAGPDGKFVPAVYDLDAFVKRGDASQNPMLAPGDVVYFDQTKGTAFNDILRAIPGLVFLDRIFD